jgi:hypothetical protein
MPTTLRIDNFAPNNIQERTVLDADVAAGGSSLTVQNNNNLAAAAFAIVGDLGREQSESRVISTPAGSTTLGIDALQFAHKRFELVTGIFGNQIQLYRSPNVDGTVPADGAFASLGSPVLIDVDQLYTDVTDATGDSNYWYKYTYRNSTSGAQSNLADSVAARGGGFGHYCSIDAIRKEAGFGNNPNITDNMISERRDGAESEINDTLEGLYVVPFVKPVPATIRNIARLLTAGYLLQAEYGPVTSGTQSEGDSKLKEAHELLDRVQNKKIVLVSAATGSSMAVPGVGGVSSWPNVSTADAKEEDSGGDHLFRVKHRY